MNKIGESPFIWLDVDATGAIGAANVAALSNLLADADDLVVMSHGWKNDKNDAARLYTELWTHTCVHFPPGKAVRTVVAGVLWPAKAFPTDFDAKALEAAGSAEGGALGVHTGAGRRDLTDKEFADVLEEFAKFLGPHAAATIAAAKKAGEKLSENNSWDLIEKGATAMGANAPAPDVELLADNEPIANVLAHPDEAQMLLLSLKAPPVFQATESVRAQSLGSVIENLFDGPRAAVARFLNLLTYYEMKSRAGVCGFGLAGHVLSKLSPAKLTKLHLVGHSFGARLVTAAADRLTPAGKLDFFSLTLLQGAYSHNGLAKVVAQNLAGAFPHVVGKPTGPIVVTHTHNDVACTLLYAVASRLARDTTKGVGDKNDEYGAMGANGPQKLDPAVLEPDDVARIFKPKRKKVNTVLADAFIVKTNDKDSHNNVTNSECGRLLAATIMA